MKDSVRTFLIVALLLFGAMLIGTVLKYEEETNCIENTIQNQSNIIDSLSNKIDSLILEIDTLEWDKSFEFDIKWNGKSILSSIMFVESSYNDSAYCKPEDAVGCLQIRKTMVDDINRILKRKGSYKRYSYQDRWNRLESINMFNLYVEYYGLKSGANLNTKLWKNAKLIGKGSFLNSEGSALGSSFLRHQISITQQIKKGLSLKIWEEEENNQTVNIIPDTLSPTSFRYTVYGSELAIKKSDKITFNVNWNQRTDYTPFNNQLNKITTANNAGVNFQFGNKKGTKFLWNSTYRELEINNSELVLQDPENTFLNRIDYKFKLWKGMLQSNSFFEIASGSELKRQYQYVEVNPGQGQYTWIDSDNDSIQDINEFQIAQFSDQASFTRVFLPTTGFIKTYNNKFNQSNYENVC